MKREPLRIGSLTFEYPFVLAPLAGITDRAMRSLCSCAGASLTFTEMVSAKGLWYGDRKTGELLRTGWPDAESLREGPVGFQLFGREPLILGYAVRVLSDPSHANAVDAAIPTTDAFGSMTGAVNRPPMGARTAEGLRPPAVFDLNAGCPVPKIVRNGEGSALLKDPDLLYECVRAMVQAAGEAAGQAGAVSGVAGAMPEVAGANPVVAGAVSGAATPIPVTVKIRKGFEADDDCAVEIARAAEAAGAAAVTVHGRTRQQYYEGRADWDAISRVKAAVKIPVIGNGDVMTGADAIRMMEETGCDGVMIARGALGNPWIFRQARALWDAGVSAAEAEKALKEAARSSIRKAPGQADAEIRESDKTAQGQSPEAADTEARVIPGLATPTDDERIRQLLQHIEMVCEDKGERVAVREMRKHVGWYIKGMRGATQVRRRINTAGSVTEMAGILAELTDEGRN